MSKTVINLDFNLDFDLTKPPQTTRRQVQPERKQLKDVKYNISDLARLEERLSLGQSLKKEKNEDARGGTEYEVILLNKTCLVVRREYIRASKLAVIIPEQAIYHIYDEISGKLLAKNDYEEFRKFFIRAPGELYEKLNSSELVWTILGSSSYYRNGRYITNYRLAQSGYSGRIISEFLDRDAPYLAIISKTKEALESRYNMSNYLSLLGRHYQAEKRDAHIRAGIRALKSGISYGHAVEFLRHDITDINIMRNMYKTQELINTHLKHVMGDRLYESLISYGRVHLVSIETVAGLRKYNVDWRTWADWGVYLLNVEEVNIFRQAYHYFDILSQQVELNNGRIREKYPKMWLSYEHKIQRIYRRHERFIKEQKKFSYSEEVEKLEHKTEADNRLYSHIMILPRTYGDVIEEGEAMQHCVANYGDRIYNHETVIMFLRKKSRPHKSFVTVEFTARDNGSRYDITQVKGVRNTNPEIDAIIYLEDYVKLNAYKHVTITDRYVTRQIENGSTELRREELRQLAEERRRERRLEDEVNQTTATTNQIHV